MMEVDIPPAEINLPWVEKYRPENLTEMISHEEIIKTLTRFIKSDKLPHLLFYGPPGTGKTSAILAVVNTMYTPKQRKSMVLELNASDDRGIGVVRCKIKCGSHIHYIEGNQRGYQVLSYVEPPIGADFCVEEGGIEPFRLQITIRLFANRDEIITFAQTKSLHIDKASSTDLKFVILDEADAMTKDAQNALRRVIEKYTANVRFCIICNYLSSIIPAIQSRCTRFRFAPLSLDHIVPKLDYVIEQEKLTVTDSGKEALLKLSCGDMRRVLNILQSASMAFPKIDETSVYQCVGQPTPKHIEKILQTLMNDTFSSACRKLQQDCGGEGYALVDIISRLHDIIFQLDLPSNVVTCLISALADTEQRLSVGASDKIQIGGIVAAFIRARKLIKEAAAKQ